VSASVNLPLHHKVQKFSSGTGSPGWSWKKGRKTVVVVWSGVMRACRYMYSVNVLVCNEFNYNRGRQSERNSGGHRGGSARSGVH